MQNGILLGYEVGSGESVYVPLHHLAIFGMTQLSGKTTALEALISRSQFKAIAFITKRGEIGFTNYNQTMPYYKPRADWQYLEGILNVALGEKVQYQPFMRWAIMKVTEGAPKTLRAVMVNAEKCMEKFSRRKEVFEILIRYLKIVVPELEKWQFTDKIDLKDGINVMDLSGMRLETQHLVIASTIEYAYQYFDHVIVIIPEAWETLPQSKMTPVKWVASQFIRKGAVLGNYLWLDSQDIGGIDKTPLRQCDNWLMGRMKEAHEVERILKQLIGAKVDAKEIQTLPLGHFYAVIGNEVKKVYVLPSGVPEEIGVQVAQGKLAPEVVKEQYMKNKTKGVMEEDMYKEKYATLEREHGELEKEFQKLKEVSAIAMHDLNITIQDNVKTIEGLKEQLTDYETLKSIFAKLAPAQTALPTANNGPSEIEINIEQPRIKIREEQKTLELNEGSLEGKIAILYANNELPEEWFSTGQIYSIFRLKAWGQDPHTSQVLDQFCQWRFLEKRFAGKRPEYHVRLSPEDARSKGLIVKADG